MAVNYATAFERVIGHEGQFQNDPNDRGNWTTGKIGVGQLKGTKYGISAMSYPEEDIENISLDRAKFLYRRDFWDRVAGDALHAALVYQLFDAAINHGIGNAIRILQRAVDVADDGGMGPVTHQAVAERGIDDVLKLFNAKRIRFFTKLSIFDRYGRGWMNRVAHNLEYAADDYTAPWYEHVTLRVA
jgi:lysozyme family protein